MGQLLSEPLIEKQIATSLRSLGLREGGIVFVHSSLSSLGYVEGGAKTVVDACLTVLGANGTLVVPTFTFAHSQQADPIFDPAHDPSEMGRITEVVRTHPASQRSHHLLHSVAALGAQAESITAVHGPSAWAADGPFWQLNTFDAQILLLGVPYLRCTYFHLLEQLVQVPYRRWREIKARCRNTDGSTRPLPTQALTPKSGFLGNDFNKLGALLEAQGVVQVGAVGNAVARLFWAKEALEIGLDHYRRDPSLFIKTTKDYAPLRDGILTPEFNSEKAVLSASHIYQRTGQGDEV
ncbi:AAC(3) family N-acetyltransferase [Chloroflexi bacterium TSY]|nr:AAC(3) family N-acetyltransferase [Chloroflexi bacterium TSY]